ncbi:AraC family transcriptional regulator [Rhodococcus sp. 14-2470-1b]|uniref:AraC-like ligand-binding domain-containing protein n=1 Tax=Rhodococcus sp. 14-2470-1b TaxID=2023149 RepID=UPI000B9AB90C|nr:helix-turn-helix domain-containing protein [Rhodococcus sp. 14-2470-1b]OZF52183.1 AraC family transcriptional regulator [Rhodococcus sp. 14-2470-1b]
MQFDRWREEVSAAFVPLDASSSASEGCFDGGLHSGSMGALHISEVSGRCVDVRRTPAVIRRSDPGLVKVGVQLRGRGVVVQRDREAVLEPGDFAVYDTSEPYALHFADDFAMFVLMFPRESLKIRPNDLAHVSALRIKGNDGVGSLVSPFLAGLRKGLSDGFSPSSRMFEDAVLDLVSAALDERAPHENTSPGAAILAGAQSFVESNLHDPGLNTAMVASSQHISPRYLQKLFESDGGVAAWIRSRRLECCRRDLEDPRLSGDSIGTICARYGLVDSAHFSRVFKEAYGMSPRQARLASL